MKMNNQLINKINAAIKALAEKAGLELTSKGNLELGSDDQGSRGTPGSQGCNSVVDYYLTPSGDVRAVIDNRYGSNQGYMEWHGGDITRMDSADLDDAIQIAKEHVESLDDADLLRAWRIASSAARATMRKIEAADATEDTEEARMIRLVDVMMGVVAGNISTGKARETLREEKYPAAVWQKVLAPLAV